MSRLLDELKKVAESAKSTGRLGEYRQGQITVPSQVILALLEDRKALLETLDRIERSKYLTRLASCCVDKTCHLNGESGKCSYQTGVNDGNADQAGEASEAINDSKERIAKLGDGE